MYNTYTLYADLVNNTKRSGRPKVFSPDKKKTSHLNDFIDREHTNPSL